jgi:hypothetical protein
MDRIVMIAITGYGLEEDRRSKEAASTVTWSRLSITTPSLR